MNAYCTGIFFPLFFIHHLFAASQGVQLEAGDFLFQDLNCGVLCNGISEVTEGVDHTRISHVGMIESVQGSEPLVVEVTGQGVVNTPLATFLARSHDQEGRPMVIVGRLKPADQPLIPKAIAYAEQQLNKPYNASFVPNEGQSFYCSQLIAAAFYEANHHHVFFPANPMNFENVKTHDITPSWQAYFETLHTQAPQGQLGTNPGMMSRSPHLTIIYAYGQIGSSGFRDF